MKRFIYEGTATNEISFPLGGIGTGSIGLAGNGRLIDWEIFNSPNKGSRNGHTHFSVKAMKNGKCIDARILNGDIYKDLAGQYGSGYGHGAANTTMAGFPHFRNCTFTGEYPIAVIDLSDPDCPFSVKLTAFNPYIPHNEKDSSIPAAFFEITVTNNTDETLDFALTGVMRNPREESVNTYFKRNGISGIFFKGAPADMTDPDYCDMTIATTEADTAHQEELLRGGWSDAMETYWRNLTEHERFAPRHYDEPGSKALGLIASYHTAGAGESFSARYVISWNCPTKKDVYLKNEYCEEPVNTIRNYYSYIFADSRDSASYALENWDRLYSDTKRWHDELFASTLPEEVLDAVSATSSVIKTETALRIGEKGDFWGWEGQNEKIGVCEGTCTHVWNYAYTMPFLFPNLERNIRETDYSYNLKPSGGLSFRIRLPFDRRISDFRPCLDGQMGSIIKVWREWKLCGDNEWLRSLWSRVKKSLEYVWSPENDDFWDRDCDGVLEGRQHHTLDMELFGPSSWLEGLYLAALKAAAEMADAMGDHEDSKKYTALFTKGKKWMSENLFNGKYFIQKVDLTDKSQLETVPETAEYWIHRYWNEELGQIKYQVGEGSIIDQMLAQWHADTIGLGEIFDPEQVNIALGNMFKNHYLTSMRNHYNPWRLFSVNDDSGAIICAFPEGAEKPGIPICYAQETMHGFEYAFAGLLISRGFLDEGLTVIRSIRDKYAGHNRNPWNELECGSNYARSMASFALIPILSGMKFDMTRGMMGFDPIINKDNFRCVWSVGSAWGNVCIKDGITTIAIISGELVLNSLVLPYMQAKSVEADGIYTGFTLRDGELVLDSRVCAKELIVIK